MSMLRQSTVNQLDKIEKEIKKQGGSLDLSNPAEKNIANGLWVHDPFEVSRNGGRKLATIDDHMKIDIPNSNEKIKKFSEFTNENFSFLETSKIVDKIEELSNYDNLDSAQTMQDNLEEINKLVKDLKFLLL